VAEALQQPRIKSGYLTALFSKPPPISKATIADKLQRIRSLARARLRLLRIRPSAVWRFVRKIKQSLLRRATGGLVKGPRTQADNIRYFANPGPGFEEADALDGQKIPSRAKTIAFYLPQFHTFDENDEWWGKGFTEWRNVARGTPRFRGHYQPRIPRDLGFYDLSNVATIAAQVALAKHNGVDAFCFYYYWFNGRRLMHKPLDLFAESNIDQQFCIMWANENWTRTWDGLENDILIKQDYLDKDEDDFIADTGRYMADERYVRVGDQPLFILYRPGLLPDAKLSIARWRKKWNAMLGVTPLVMMVQGFNQEDPREFGLDGAIEFPPHKVCAGLHSINDLCHILDSNYQGLVRDYREVVEKSLHEKTPEFTLIKTVSPSWDNDARREALGMTIHGSTPALYEKWLNGAMDFALDHPVNGESVVFINAWNEWAEGAYLEPDVHFGHAYLNATKRAAKGIPAQTDAGRILLLGHDAHRHGAQMLLLNMAKTYRRQFGMEVVIVLKEGGPLVGEYKRVAQTHVLSKMGKNGLHRLLARGHFTAAICNTSVTGDLIPQLRHAGLKIVSLVHEMPNLIKDYQLESRIQSIANKAHHVVFAAQTVQDGFEQFIDTCSATALIRPQGTYTPVHFDAQARKDIRSQLGIAAQHKIVVGVGYADLRKGFDLFMDAARRLMRRDDCIHFVWVGALSADMQRWIQTDFSQREDQSRLHIIGFTDRIKDYYSAADCLFLSSREDPYPTVVLEAMNVGLPVIMHRATSGFDSLMQTHGYVVDIGDSEQLDQAIGQALAETDESKRLARVEHVELNCQFDDYCFSLLELLHPQLRRISVVVPNYNYAQYIEQRLTSIFSQNHPVFEVILLDDSSNDNSVEVAQRLAQNVGRYLRVHRSETNSGSVFAQWQHAAQIARAELLWIAEADDSAAPGFLNALSDSFSNNTVLAFCDSRQIGADNEHLSNSYQHYFAKADARLFAHDFNLPALEFAARALSVRNVIMNVSGVLWDNTTLKQCFSTIADELQNYDLVGDWRIYLEALSSNDASVAFVADALNVHRRHSASVTQSLDVNQHVKEIAAMHQYVLAKMPLDIDTQETMEKYLNEISVQLDSSDTSKKVA